MQFKDIDAIYKLAIKYKLDFRVVDGIYMSNECSLEGLEELVKEYCSEHT